MAAVGDLGVEQFTEAGLYDPDAPDAASRLALLTFLAESGAGLDEMATADARGRLFALAGDRIVRPGRDEFTLDEVAERIGAEPAEVRAVWRALGLVAQGSDEPVASELDITAVRTVVEIGRLIGLPAALGVSRVVASGLARVADAISTAVRVQVPDLALGVSGSELATAQSFAAVTQFVPLAGAMLDVVFRHHLENARMHFERTDSEDLLADGGVRLGVGFADLSGFTGLTERLTMAELSGLLTGFEQVSEDIVRDGGGRVVKFIGDAVMYVAPDAASAAAIGESLLAGAQVRGLQARVGVTAGVVLALEGDYFGPVVNLAARLVAMAAPGEILITAPVATALPDTARAVALGPRPVRGFTEPVEVLALR